MPAVEGEITSIHFTPTGETSDYECEANRDLGETSTCTFTDTAFIGNVTAVRVRRTNANYWKLERISLEVDGVLVGIHKNAEIRHRPVTLPLEYQPPRGNVT